MDQTLEFRNLFPNLGLNRLRETRDEVVIDKSYAVVGEMDRQDR